MDAHTPPPPPDVLGDDQVDSTVALFGAIAHPVRLRVLMELYRRGPLAVGELQRALGAEQSALSHQLRTLRDARLIAGERDGKRVRYRLVDEHVAHIIADAMAHAVEPAVDREPDGGAS
jgi:ArsR family transcriptional regulator